MLSLSCTLSRVGLYIVSWFREKEEGAVFPDNAALFSAAEDFGLLHVIGLHVEHLEASKQDFLFSLPLFPISKKMSSTPSLNIRRVLGDETDSDPNIQLLPPSPKKPTSSSKYSVKDEIHIFDGRNTPQNISVYGFLLGMVCSAGIMFAILSDSHIPQFGIFLAALSLFHFLEYVATALFNADKLSLDCKYQRRS